MALALGQQVSADDIMAYTSGEPQMLVLRFRADGFEGAGSLARLMEQHPAQLSGAFVYGALEHAYVLEEWPMVTTYAGHPVRARTFVLLQHLHERPEALGQFIDQVLPFVEVSLLADPDDFWPLVDQIAQLA